MLLQAQSSALLQVSPHSAREADAERARRDLPRMAERKVFERELVSEFIRRAAHDRGLANRIQRSQTPQQLAVPNTKRVRCAVCGRRLLQCWCGARGLKRRPLAPRPHPHANRRWSERILSHAQVNESRGQVRSPRASTVDFGFDVDSNPTTFWVEPSAHYPRQAHRASSSR